MIYTIHSCSTDRSNWQDVFHSLHILPMIRTRPPTCRLLSVDDLSNQLDHRMSSHWSHHSCSSRSCSFFFFSFCWSHRRNRSISVSFAFVRRMRKKSCWFRRDLSTSIGLGIRKTNRYSLFSQQSCRRKFQCIESQVRTSLTSNEKHVVLSFSLSNRIRSETNGWCPASKISSTSYEYIQIDLGNVTVITLIELQGTFSRKSVRPIPFRSPTTTSV